MAFPDRQWARGWRNYVQDRFLLDPLQLGQLLLLALALITLAFLLMSAFCGCFPHNKRRRRKTQQQLNRSRNSSTNGGGGGQQLPLGSNEERRRLLQPLLATPLPERVVQIEVEKDSDQDSASKDNTAHTPAVVPSHQQPLQQPLTPFPGYRRPQLADQSPPPPRRLAPTGGRTQVLPLTGGNRRRVPALMLLMADQESSSVSAQTAPPPSSGRSVGTPESKATTAGAKSCETIPEDPECDLSEELLSIDRTLLSAAASTGTMQPQLPCSQPLMGCRTSFRLASPFPAPPPKFELPAPTYSPPEPPSHGQNDATGCHQRLERQPSATKSNLSSPDQSSYGGQTPLNTTTGSSDSAGLGTAEQGCCRVRISELECSDSGPTTATQADGTAVQSEEEALENAVPHWSSALAAGGAQMPPGPAGGGGRGGKGQLGISTRVPRSISQQLELMEELAAAAAAAGGGQPVRS